MTTRGFTLHILCFNLLVAMAALAIGWAAVAKIVWALEHLV